MAVTKSQMASNKKYDKAHFKYQTVKMKISEHEKLKEALEVSKEPMNTFLRTAIMKRVGEFVETDDDSVKTDSDL